MRVGAMRYKAFFLFITGKRDNEEINSRQHSQQQNSNSHSSGRLDVYETICLDLSEDLVNRFFASVAEISLGKGQYF